MPEEHSTEEEHDIKVKEKIIMGYKMKFKTGYDETDSEGEYIKLTFSISDELKQLLRNSCVNSLTNVKIAQGENREGGTEYITAKRYKIKSVINNNLSTAIRDIMFIKELVDNGEVSLNFRNVDKVIRIIDALKSNFRTLIETVVGCLNISQEVTFNVLEGTR